MRAKTLEVLPVIIVLVLTVTSVVYAQTVVSQVTISVEKDGSPVSNVYVEVYDANDTRIFSGYTDANGAITLTNVTTGDYKIKVVYEDRFYIFDVKIDESTTEIKLDLSEVNWLKSNWKLLAIGAGAGILLILLLGACRRII